MKIAAIALASAFAAALGIAPPASAQQSYGQPTYGSQQGFNNQGNQGPMGNQNSGPMTNNQNPQWNGNWHNGQQMQGHNWRQGQNQSPGHMQRWGMQGHMGPMWQHHAMMNQGTSFAFGNGKARIFVHCAQSESLQDCTNAANSLLDQIASSRKSADSGGSTNGSASSSTNGLGRSSMGGSGNYGSATGSGSVVRPDSDMQNSGQNPASDTQDQEDSGE